MCYCICCCMCCCMCFCLFCCMYCCLCCCINCCMRCYVLLYMLLYALLCVVVCVILFFVLFCVYLCMLLIFFVQSIFGFMTVRTGHQPPSHHNHYDYPKQHDFYYQAPYILPVRIKGFLLFINLLRRKFLRQNQRSGFMVRVEIF